MKILGAISILLTFSSAFAGELYTCQGRNEKNMSAQIDIAFESIQKATVTDMEGTEIKLDLARTTTRGKVYGNYEYDGYGGSVELIVPKNFEISGSNAAEEFKARYQQRVYSELGHVATVSFIGDCQRTDN